MIMTGEEGAEGPPFEPSFSYNNPTSPPHTEYPPTAPRERSKQSVVQVAKRTGRVAHEEE